MVMCAVVGCTKVSGRHEARFFSIPSVIKNQCLKTLELSTRRRKEWILKIRREDLGEGQVKPYTRVCNLHFVSGAPAKLFDSMNPDWSPSMNMGYKTLAPNQLQALSQRHKRMANRRSLGQQQQAKREPLLEVNENGQHADPQPLPEECPPQPMECELQPMTREMACQTDITALDLERLELECNSLRSELRGTKIKLLEADFSQDALSINDEKVRFYTGLPTFLKLITLFNFLAEYIPTSHRNALPQFSEFLIFLMRLRLNLSLKDLAYRFNVSPSTISRLFDKWLDVASVHIEFLIHWPDRESLQTSMPRSFRNAFGSSVAVILDCFEVFIERPSSLLTRAMTWSQYKHHNTVKFLIGITPQGTVSFISAAWGGRVSDKYITEQCGILKKLVPGDVVMADRGFDISDSVGFMCAKLLIPAFTHGKPQLSGTEISETRKLASLRIHVERVIGLVRNKYHILQGVLPIDTLVLKNGQASPPIDKIGIVACALANLCPPIVPLE